MRRGLFTLNLVLFFLLALLLVLDGWDFLERRAYAMGLAGNIPAGSIRLSGVSEDGFFIQFPEFMAEKGEIGNPLEKSPVTLVPHREITCWWREPDLLRVVPARPLPRGLRFHVRLARPMASLGGRRVDPGLDLLMETPTVRLLQVVALFPGKDAAPSSVGKAALTFDLPLPGGELAAHLVAEDLQGRPLVAGVKAPPSVKGRIFLVTMKRRKGEESIPLQKVKIRILPGLLPRGCEVPLKSEIVRFVDFNGRILLRKMEAEKGKITLRFDREVPLPEKGWIQVHPPVSFQVFRGWGGMTLAGDFEPGKVYRVILKKGFPGKGPKRLRSAIHQALLVPDLEPSVRFASRGEVLSGKARPELDLVSVNLDACRVEVRTLYPNNSVVFANRGRWSFPDRAFGPWRGKVYALGGPPNETTSHRIPLGDLVEGDLVGLHQVRIRPLDGMGRPKGWWSEKILQVTDLGITARTARGWTAVRVTSLAGGGGAAGARVRVLSRANQLLAEGTTGKDGVVLLRLPTAGSDQVPFLVEAIRGKDRSFLDLEHYRVEVLEDRGFGRPYLTSGVEAYVFMDRGIVRPGGTARAAVMVRDPACLAAAGAAVEARWLDPSGRVRRKREIQIPGGGLLVLEKKFGPSDSTGVWTLEILHKGSRVGSASLRVGAFVPDRLEVKVRPEGPFILGKRGAVLVKANWLEGSPAGKLPGRLLVRFDRADVRFEGYEGYSFGPAGKIVPPGAREPLSFALGKKGKARVLLDFTGPKKCPQVLSVRVTAEVEDPSGRPARGGFEEKVFRPGGILGIEADEKGASLVLLDRNGKLVDSSTVVTVVHQVRRWHWGLKPLRWGRYTYETFIQTREVEKKKVRLSGGRARVEFRGLTSEGPGWHVISARLEGVLAEQAVGTVPGRPDRLRVTCLNAPVRPGGEVRLGLDAPFGGSAFVTLEGAGIHGTRVFEVKAGHTVVRVPVPSGLTLPNLHAVVTLTRPQDVAGAAPPFLVTGGTSFALDRPERRTEVTLEFPGKVRPRSRVVLGIRAPGATLAVAALVDEGVLRVTGHSSPDPLGWFLAARRNDIEGADTRTSLYDKPRFEAPPVRGGGEGRRPSLGPRLTGSISPFIRPVALSSGIVELDRNGWGRVVFDLPPYEGRLRVMVLASGPEVTGAASEPLVVTSPLGLLAAGPRMLSPGDESGVVLTVANRSGKPGEVTLSLKALGGAVLPPGEETSRLLLLRKGETRNLHIPFLAGPRPGRQGFSMTARMGKETRQVDCVFLVRAPSLYAELRRGFAFDRKGEIRIPGKWSTQGLRVRIKVGSGLDEALFPLLRRMVRYPYGCVEQTASRGFALLAAGRLLPRVVSGDGPPLEFSGMVTAGVDRILSMQNSLGGLSFWPGGKDEYRFGTVYGLDFLLSAKERGFDVPGGALAALMDRVAGYLGEGDLSLRCYAAEVLSRGGRPVGPWLTLFSERVRDSGDREAAARTALGLHRLGRKKDARRLLFFLESMDPWKKREQVGLLRSPLRGFALELLARLRIDPASDRTARLAGRLERLLHGITLRSPPEDSQAPRHRLSQGSVTRKKRTEGRATASP